MISLILIFTFFIFSCEDPDKLSDICTEDEISSSCVDDCGDVIESTENGHVENGCSIQGLYSTNTMKTTTKQLFSQIT